MSFLFLKKSLVSKFSALVFFRLHLMTFYFFLTLFIVTWRKIIVLISAICQHGSVIGIHMSPLPWASLPPHPTPLGCHRVPVWAPQVKQQICTDCFTYGGVYVSMLLSPFVSPSPSWPRALGPQVCSLRLCLYCCPVNRFISTIFLLMTFEIFVYLFGCAGS